MKKTDIAMIILIASVSVMTSFFVAKSILGDKFSGGTVVQTIEKIGSDIEKPSKDIFNKDAMNPTVQVQINGSSETKDSGNE